MLLRKFKNLLLHILSFATERTKIEKICKRDNTKSRNLCLNINIIPQLCELYIEFIAKNRIFIDFIEYWFIENKI